MRLRGILLDIQGVLVQNGKPIEGAKTTLGSLRAEGLGVRFLTNVTTHSRRAIAEELRGLGFDLPNEEVFSPPIAACARLRELRCRRIHLAASRNLEEDFSSFTLADEEVDAVVLGDLHRDFTWDRLNRLFEMLVDGAHLVALHKNRYCRRGQSLALDLGPFVAALEYASGREAIVVGKPSADFFEMALADLNLSARDVVMVGDDLEADIGGAQNAGIRAIQVETGKYRPEDQAHPSVHADVRIPSVAALPDELAHL